MTDLHGRQDALSSAADAPRGLDTPSEARKEEAAAAAFERIKTGQHWRDWMYVAAGLEVGRMKCLRAIGANATPQHPGYKREFKNWMAGRPWARDLDSPTRAHLFWCLDFANEIETWRDTLAQNIRARLNHPTSMKRAYEAAHRDTAVITKRAKTPEALAHEEEVGKLKDEIAMRQREIDFLKATPTVDGGLFDIVRDSLKDIARTFRGNTSLARTRGLRDELSKIVREEEAALRKSTSKQAG
jgi:hypothetical protein